MTGWANPALWLAIAAVVRAFTPDVLALIARVRTDRAKAGHPVYDERNPQ